MQEDDKCEVILSYRVHPRPACLRKEKGKEKKVKEVAISSFDELAGVHQL